jgi:hypothetical protein
MSSAPPNTKQVSVMLSDTELASVEAFAKANGLTLDQACDTLTVQALQAEYVKPKRFNNVVRFPQ